MTYGISPKVWVPFAAQLVAIVVVWVVTGAYDQVELAQTLTAFGQVALGYRASPGAVDPLPGADVASDELLGDPSPPKEA